MNEILEGDIHQKIKEIPDNTIDLIVTSPPYANLKSYGKSVNVFHPDRYVDWFLPLQVEFYRILKPTGSFILNINDCCVKKQRHPYIYELIYRSCKETPMKFYDKYYWHKTGGYLPNCGSSGKRLNTTTEYIFHFCKDEKQIKWNMDDVREPYRTGTLSRYAYKCRANDKVDENGETIPQYQKTYGAKIYGADENGERITVKHLKGKVNPLGKVPDNVFEFPTNAVTRGNKHPAPFHPDLPEWFIRALTDEGDVVLDPFMGSGTTALVAQRMNRNWLGIELNPVYIEMAMERIDPIHWVK